MINKTAMVAIVALVAGFASVAGAQDHHRDPNTGLASHLYYQPLYELEQRGAPMSNRAKEYLKQHPGPGATAARRGNGRVPGAFGGALGARAQERAPSFQLAPGNGSASWPCIPQYDSAGVQTAPYCHH
jgi:hypothetical protein